MRNIFMTIFISLLFSGCYTQIIEDLPPQIPEIICIDTMFIKNIPSSASVTEELRSEGKHYPPGYEYRIKFTLQAIDSLGSLAENFYLSWSSPNEHNQGYLLTPWDIKKISKYRYIYFKNFDIRYKGIYSFFICKTPDLFRLKDDAQLENYYLEKSVSVEFQR